MYGGICMSMQKDWKVALLLRKGLEEVCDTV